MVAARHIPGTPSITDDLTEPGSMGLLLIGGALFVGVRRKLRRH